MTSQRVGTLGDEVRAVIAMPRLSFTYSNFDILNALYPLGIPVAKRCGLWWEQLLTPLLEESLDAKYILTIDYDSRFKQADVVELYRLMEAHPEADAIAPVQIQRGKTTPLFTIRDPFTGQNKTQLAIDPNADLLRVHTAHFGLTMIRAASLRELPKPWFMALPDKEGGWDVGKGAVQADMFFWRRWEEQNRSLYVAPKVRIGHLFECVLMADENLNGAVMSLEDYDKR